MATMTYQEYKQKRQEEFNSLPVFFAFGNDQFREQMEKRGLTENDTDKIYSMGMGGYFLKKDAKIVEDFYNKPDELPELMKDYDFAFSAFYYEMGNHEYHINHYQGDWDVCNCFATESELPYYGDDLYGSAEREKYFDCLKWSEETRRAYRNARSKFLHDADENDWY